MKLLFLEPPQAKIYQYQFPCVFSSYNAVMLFYASFIVKNQFPHSKRRETKANDICNSIQNAHRRHSDHRINFCKIEFIFFV